MKKIVLYLLCSFLVASCSKEDQLKGCTNKPLGDGIQHSQYTIEPLSDIESRCFELSKALSYAIEEHPQVISLIRSEVNKQVYGEFEVLVSTLVEKEVPFSIESSSGSGYSVRHVLEGYLMQSGSVNSEVSNKTSNTFLSDLLQELPLLSISVPVLQEQLNQANPPIVVLNRGIETDLTHIGFHSGDTVYLSASIPPSAPVLALGLSERASLESSAFQTELFSLNTPFSNSSIVLSSATSTNGITLNWTFQHAAVEGVNPGVQGYHIYRLGGLSTSPTLVGVVGNANTVYEDQDLYPLTQYTYFIRAFNMAGGSSASNISTCTTGKLPVAPTSFEANILSASEVSLLWTMADTTPYQGVRLYKKVIGDGNENPEFTVLHTEEGDYHTLTDNTVDPSTLVFYKLTSFSGLGESNERFDFVEVPYRNGVEYSPVKIKKIEFPNNQLSNLEGWIGGKPEFKFHMVLLKEDGSTVTLQNDLQLDFSSRTNSQDFNALIHNWQPVNWMERIVIHAEEYNKSLRGFKELTIQASYKKKNALKTGFDNGSVYLEISNVFRKGDTGCGQGYLEYTSPKTSTIVFPNYGLKLNIAEN